MSIREGFEWTEVEPPVRCVCCREGDMERGGQAFRKIDRETDRQAGRQEETEGKRDKERELRRCELI